jgi:hypothetical protein
MTAPYTHVTVIAPLGRGGIDGAHRAARVLAERLRQPRWREIEGEVLAHCGMVHMARFQLIDRLTPEMGAGKYDRMSSKYLLFAAEIDGRSDDFYDHLYRFDRRNRIVDPGDGGFVRRIWGNCRGFPRQTGEVFFRRFMERFEVRASIKYAGVDASAREILEALLVQALWRAFPRTEGSPMAFDEAWRSLRGVLATLPLVQTEHLVALLDLLNDGPLGSGLDQLAFHEAIVEIEQLVNAAASEGSAPVKMRYG